jgi:uncharacterized damage-inducible protein DinB
VTETERILDQFERAFSGDAWYGDSILEILENVRAEKALARPFPNALNIWQIVLHLTFTEKVMRRRLEGEEAKIVGSEDFPPVPETSETAWENAIRELKNSHEKLKETIKNLDDAQLDESVKGWDHSKYFLLHGLIQHLIYHGGQIALIKKFSANEQL